MQDRRRGRLAKTRAVSMWPFLVLSFACLLSPSPVSSSRLLLLSPSPSPLSCLLLLFVHPVLNGGNLGMLASCPRPAEWRRHATGALQGISPGVPPLFLLVPHFPSTAAIAFGSRRLKRIAQVSLACSVSLFVPRIVRSGTAKATGTTGPTGESASAPPWMGGFLAAGRVRRLSSPLAFLLPCPLRSSDAFSPPRKSPSLQQSGMTPWLDFRRSLLTPARMARPALHPCLASLPGITRRPLSRRTPPWPHRRQIRPGSGCTQNTTRAQPGCSRPAASMATGLLEGTANKACRSAWTTPRRVRPPNQW